MSFPVSELFTFSVILTLSGFVLGVCTLAIFAVVRGSRSLEIGARGVEGAIGRITLEVPDKGVGRVSFLRHGGRVSLPAKSTDGRRLPKDTSVLVVEIENGVAVVAVCSSEVVKCLN